MSKFIVFLSVFMGWSVSTNAQFSVNYKPDQQPTTNLQYFTPKGDDLFVGDCIPFAHEGVFYLYWLLDKGHHASLNGMGGHQWVLSTTSDLKNWTHHPVVLGIDEDWEKSICTGSVVYKDGKFHAFYATRLIDGGKINEKLSYAVSDDGIHFKKQTPNPFFTAPEGYSSRNFRDPKAIIDPAGRIKLLISSDDLKAPIQRQNGCLVQLTSTGLDNLKDWRVDAPLLTGQRDVPECPDYFRWNNWYYLIYSQAGDTYYVKSKNPGGPWEYPHYQSLKEDMSNVVKTAEFGKNRRIATGWIPSRRNNKDNGGEIFGGSTVFRELIQEVDGTLSTRFPVEMIPTTSKALSLPLVLDQSGTQENQKSVLIKGQNGLGAAHVKQVPPNSRITLTVVPSGKNEEYGFFLRSDEKGEKGYQLRVLAGQRTVSLGNTRIEAVEGLEKELTLDIVMKEDIMDVCINGKRCIINRMPEEKGEFFWLYAKQGAVRFKNLTISPIQ